MFYDSLTLLNYLHSFIFTFFTLFLFIIYEFQKDSDIAGGNSLSNKLNSQRLLRSASLQYGGFDDSPHAEILYSTARLLFHNFYLPRRSHAYNYNHRPFHLAISRKIYSFSHCHLRTLQHLLPHHQQVLLLCPQTILDQLKCSKYWILLSQRLRKPQWSCGVCSSYWSFHFLIY